MLNIHLMENKLVLPLRDEVDDADVQSLVKDCIGETMAEVTDEKSGFVDIVSESGEVVLYWTHPAPPYSRDYVYGDNAGWVLLTTNPELFTYASLKFS